MNQSSVISHRPCILRCLLVLILSPLYFGVTFGADNAAQRAVQEAKKYSGTTITMAWEAGLQSLDPLNYSGPRWEKLTGIKVKVIEVPLAELYSKVMLEYRAGTSAYDVLDVVPSWMSDLAQAGALEPLDAYVDKYGYREELQKIAPTFRDNWMTSRGKIYAFPDDGDVLILYYRKDIFTDPGTKAAFMSMHGYELQVPKTWKQFDEIGAFLTAHLKKEGIYGGCNVRDPALAQYMFQERFRNEGGQFFDVESMKATINSAIGVRVFNEMHEENKFMPPGIEKFTFPETLAVFSSGQCAMTVSWPPVGRWTAGYGTNEKALDWVPKSKIAGKVGYSLPPGGHPQLAIGHGLSISSRSKHKDAAYLFIQWLNSEDISLQRVQLPYTLRDPFRTSHYSSPEYLAKWPDANEYLGTLKNASETGLQDLSLIQTDKYTEVLRQAFGRLWAGEDPKTILDDSAKQWNEITAQIGLDKQRTAYRAWVSKPGAYPR